jgi:hypothetical protein
VTGIVLLTTDEEAPKEATSPSRRLARSSGPALSPKSRTKLELNPYAGLNGGGASAKLSF